MWFETVNPFPNWSYREVSGVPTRTCDGRVPQFYLKNREWADIPGLNENAGAEDIINSINKITNQKGP